MGGPSKARELARRVPTAVVYASPDARARRGRSARWLETPYYRIDESADQRGLEVCSALKNAYAIGIGLCDGLVAAAAPRRCTTPSRPLYTQALAEMLRLGRAVRARPGTVTGSAARATCTSPAWRAATASSASCAARGCPRATVVATLAARDELTEGYAAIRWCWRFARSTRWATCRCCARCTASSTGRDVERELRAACFPQPRARRPLNANITHPRRPQ